MSRSRLLLLAAMLLAPWPAPADNGLLLKVLGGSGSVAPVCVPHAIYGTPPLSIYGTPPLTLAC